MKSLQGAILKSFVGLNIALFRLSGGRILGRMRGLPVLLLTTTGRKSGAPRTVPVVYDEDAGEAFVVASFAGAPQHPAWFLNLQRTPTVEVERRGIAYTAKAEILSGAERQRLWNKIVAAAPYFQDEYQSRTKREIPVVRLRRDGAREIERRPGEEPRSGSPAR